MVVQTFWQPNIESSFICKPQGPIHFTEYAYHAYHACAYTAYCRQGLQSLLGPTDLGSQRQLF